MGSNCDSSTYYGNILGAFFLIFNFALTFPLSHRLWICLDLEWIMEQWEKSYYISAIAGANNGSSLVVMSKGTQYLQQSYKVSDSFPFKLINKKCREGFYVTSWLLQEVGGQLLCHEAHDSLIRSY
ncbi:hypothetical protein UlMin_012442 [Ulmus minor]